MLRTCGWSKNTCFTSAWVPLFLFSVSYRPCMPMSLYSCRQSMMHWRVEHDVFSVEFTRKYTKRKKTWFWIYINQNLFIYNFFLGFSFKWMAINFLMSILSVVEILYFRNFISFLSLNSMFNWFTMAATKLPNVETLFCENCFVYDRPACLVIGGEWSFFFSFKRLHISKIETH